MKSRIIVIKLGTSSICNEESYEPLLSNLSTIVETAVILRRQGHKVLIVSSGAIGIGLRRMDLHMRPKHLATVQAIAAVGQCRLIALWDELFKQLRQPIAQILLTRNDIADRTQYLNAANTILELLRLGVVPIINENDTLSVSEIKFGDNDTLSAIAAGMVNADYLFLMTDVDCLYDENPRVNPNAKPIHVVEEISELLIDVSTSGSALGTGGMSTKLIAAELATCAGVTTIISKSSVPGNILKITRFLDLLEDTPELPLQVEVPLHTRFLRKKNPVRDRHFWLLHGLTPHGTVFIDVGAFKALTRTDRAGLLPVGVVGVEGTFGAQVAVSLRVSDLTTLRGLKGADKFQSNEVGRALVNYSSWAIEKIRGRKSADIFTELGYADSEYVAHRDNLAFFPQVSDGIIPHNRNDANAITSRT